MSKYSRTHLSWHDITLDRWEDAGSRCGLCKQHISISEVVGHHIRNRNPRDGGQDVSYNCEPRHPSCEALAHKLHPKGNPYPRVFERAYLRGEVHAIKPLRRCPNAEVLAFLTRHAHRNTVSLAA